MSKAYMINHYYTEYLGDDIIASYNEVAFITTDKEAAEKWVEQWSHPINYDDFYEGLTAYEFVIEEIDILDTIDPSISPRSFTIFHPWSCSSL